MQTIEVYVPVSFEKSLTKTAFTTGESLDEAAENIIRLVPETKRNTLITSLWVYHNTLVKQIQEQVNLLGVK